MEMSKGQWDCFKCSTWSMHAGWDRLQVFARRERNGKLTESSTRCLDPAHGLDILIHCFISLSRLISPLSFLDSPSRADTELIKVIVLQAKNILP